MPAKTADRHTQLPRIQHSHLVGTQQFIGPVETLAQNYRIMVPAGSPDVQRIQHPVEPVVIISRRVSLRPGSRHSTAVNRHTVAHIGHPATQRALYLQDIVVYHHISAIYASVLHSSDAVAT